MRKEDCIIFSKIEYICKDIDNNIVIGISKKTKVDDMVRILKIYEGREVNITIVPATSKKVNDSPINDSVNDVFYLLI